MYALLDRARAHQILAHYDCVYVCDINPGSEGWKTAQGYAFTLNAEHGGLYDEHMLRQVLSKTLEIEPPSEWPV